MNSSNQNQEIHHLQWMGIPYVLKWKPNYFEGVISHLEIRSENGEPLPMTETGYRSHFVSCEEVIKYGWPVPYIEAWIDEETGRYHNNSQRSLF